MGATLAIGLLLQSTWLVDANNPPGTNFTDLPPAVAAAQSGDVIRVRAGSYSGFAVAGKSLTIRGDGQVLCTVGRSEFAVAGESVRLSGLRFLSTGVGLDASALRLSGSGRVAMLDCRVDAGENAALQQAGLAFETEPEDQPWLWREALIKDPDGHPIKLYQADENRINPPWRV